MIDDLIRSSGILLSFRDKEPELCHRIPAPVQGRDRSGEMTDFLFASVRSEVPGSVSGLLRQVHWSPHHRSGFPGWLPELWRLALSGTGIADLVRIAVCIFFVETTSFKGDFPHVYAFRHGLSPYSEDFPQFHLPVCILDQTIPSASEKHLHILIDITQRPCLWYAWYLFL